jgi:hypothetical protein
MSQKIYHKFMSENSTKALNEHIAKLIAPGVYEGLRVTVNEEGSSLNLDISEGFALTNEGIKIVIEDKIENAVTIELANTVYNRVDLVVLRYKYSKTYDQLENVATFHVIRGQTPNTPPDEDSFAQEGEPENWLEDTDIILAQVSVPNDRQYLLNEDIFNRRVIMTTQAAMSTLSSIIYTSLGNFISNGWQVNGGSQELTDEALISRGTGLINGQYNTTVSTTVVPGLYQPRRLVYPAGNPEGVCFIRELPAEGSIVPPDNIGSGENLDLSAALRFPSRLKIAVQKLNLDGNPIVAADADPIVGRVVLTGQNEYNNPIQEEIEIVAERDEDGIMTTTVVTSNRYRSISPEGIDFIDILDLDYKVSVEITDMPVAYIKARNNDSGTPTFYAEYDVTNLESANELVIAVLKYNKSSENEPNLTQTPTGVFMDIVQDFSSQCDGVNRQFLLDFEPEANSEVVVLDGNCLLRDSINSKGYTLEGTTLTLQEGLPAPDGGNSITGSAGADFWVRYRRIRGAMVEGLGYGEDTHRWRGSHRG